jgi:hypothetical protein
MFALKVAKPQIKTAESSILVRGRLRLSRDRLAYGQERLAGTMSKRPNQRSTERHRGASIGVLAGFRFFRPTRRLPFFRCLG